MLEVSFPRKVSVHADYGEQERCEEFSFGEWVMRDKEEDARAYDRLRIPPRKLGWVKNHKFFGQRKKGPHGWHAHPRCKRFTARRKPQAREMNRQYRPFGKKACKESRPDLKPPWRVVDSVDEPLSEVKKKMELEKLVGEELQAEAAQGASTSY